MSREPREDPTAEPVTISAGRADDLGSGEAVVVRANGREVAVFNDRGTFVGLDNRCLHRGGPIGEGFVKDGTVTCPWHWWRYDVRTGKRLGAPFLRLEGYLVEVRDGEIMVEVPPAEEPVSIRELLLRHARQAREEHP